MSTYTCQEEGARRKLPRGRVAEPTLGMRVALNPLLARRACHCPQRADLHPAATRPLLRRHPREEARVTQGAEPWGWRSLPLFFIVNLFYFISTSFFFFLTHFAVREVSQGKAVETVPGTPTPDPPSPRSPLLPTTHMMLVTVMPVSNTGPACSFLSRPSPRVLAGAHMVLRGLGPPAPGPHPGTNC